VQGHGPWQGTCRLPPAAAGASQIRNVIRQRAFMPLTAVRIVVFARTFAQEGQHQLTGQRAANFRLLANQ